MIIKLLFVRECTILNLFPKRKLKCFCYWNSWVAGTMLRFFFSYSSFQRVEGDFDIKLPEIKGCLLIEFFNLSIAVKCLIFCYEIHRSKISHRKFNETMVPGNVQWMAMFKINHCVACSGFSLLSIHEDEQSLSLVHSSCSSVRFLAL